MTERQLSAKTMVSLFRGMKGWSFGRVGGRAVGKRGEGADMQINFANFAPGK